MRCQLSATSPYAAVGFFGRGFGGSVPGFARMRLRLLHVRVPTPQHGFAIVRAVGQSYVCQEAIILIPRVAAGPERHINDGAIQHPVRRFRCLAGSAFGPALGVRDLRGIVSKDPNARFTVISHDKGVAVYDTDDPISAFRRHYGPDLRFSAMVGGLPDTAAGQ